MGQIDEIKSKLFELIESLDESETDFHAKLHEKSPNIVYSKLCMTYANIMREEKNGHIQEGIEILNAINCLEKYFPNIKIR